MNQKQVQLKWIKENAYCVYAYQNVSSIKYIQILSTYMFQVL